MCWPHREQARSHSGFVLDMNLCSLEIGYGSELARDSGVIADEDAGCAVLIASKLAPTGETRSHQQPGRLSGRLALDVDLGHTEPKRGAEWWGKSVLVTFDWAGFRALQK